MHSFQFHVSIEPGTGFRWKNTILSAINDKTLFLYEAKTRRILKVPFKNPPTEGRARLSGSLTGWLCEQGFIENANNVNSDEITPRKPYCPSAVTIAPTLACNLSCPYCFERKGRGPMSWSNCDELATFLTAQSLQTGSPLHITWYGGEPMLAVPQIERVSLALLNSDIGLSAKIITNGTIMNASMVDRIHRVGVSSAQVTLGGCRLDHERTRPSQSSQPTFDRVISTISQLISRKILTTVRINLFQDAVPRIFDLFTENTFMALSDNPLIEINVIIIDEDIHKVSYRTLQQIRQEFNCRGFRVRGLNAAVPRVHSCSAVRSSDICVGPDLELYRCYSHFGHSNAIIGELRCQGIQPKLCSLESTKTVDLLESDCETCDIRKFCHNNRCQYQLLTVGKISGLHSCDDARAAARDEFFAFITEYTHEN